MNTQTIDTPTELDDRYLDLVAGGGQHDGGGLGAILGFQSFNGNGNGSGNNGISILDGVLNGLTIL